MIKNILTILIFLILIFIPNKAFAQTNSFVSIVNPVRGEDFWDQKGQKIATAVIGEAQILKQFNLKATWLLRFDALENQEIVNVINERVSDEKGLFLEVTPTWSAQSGVSYHKSESWHFAGSAFLTGYERDEREKLIDSSFLKFKTIFGYYPKSVGAWWIDAYSLAFMQKKYGILSAMIVSDQYTTDNYQIWGQYFSTPYYPAKNNAIHPAQNLDDKLSLVMTQWAARDPVNSYGNGVSESTYSVQANDYKDFHNLDTNYFSKLLDIYTNQPLNNFSHMVVGLENSYPFEKYKEEYENQIETISKKTNQGQFLVVTLKDFASWYMANFPNLSPAHVVVADDPLGTFKKAVWFMNPYFRVGWFYNEDGSLFRDVRQYAGGDEELCFQKRCDEVNFATFAARVLDNVTFGQKYILDQGKIKDFKVTKRDDKYAISYINEADRKRQIDFLTRDINIDGKSSSVDNLILNATEGNLTQKSTVKSIETGSFKWSPTSVFLKIVRFVLFLLFACLIPGLVISKKADIFLSSTIGLVCLTLVFYIASLIKFKTLVPIYTLLTLILFICFRFSNFKYPNPIFKNKLSFLSAGLIFLGTIFQILPTLRSGLEYSYGLGLWGPNTHDGLWHIALINQLTKVVPPQNPIFAGPVLKNYHFFYDLLIAATNFLTGIPILDLVFRFYPILFSLLLGIGTYYLTNNLFKKKLATIFSLYLVYFAGSFGWIVEYLKEKHLGGESAFWANQSISFNLNPPFAISLIIIIAIFQLLFTTTKIQKNVIFILVILCGTLISFKSYAAVLILFSLLIVSILKRSIPLFVCFIFSTISSLLLFISNFSLGMSLLLFSPFWFIHSMVDASDRVGWTRLSLARTTGYSQGNWFKFISSETISLFLFLVGNLGTRFFAIFLLLKFKAIFANTSYLFIFIFSLLSLSIPIFFIQSGNPWNTIQFIYYFLYVAAVTSGLVLARIVTKLNQKLSYIFITIFLIITPINSWATANSYLSDNPHAKVSSKELEALKFLSSQKDGIVLAYPYDKNLKLKLNEPWPIFAYDSTAYVAAISGKSVYLEDEAQNQILLTDYKRRLVGSIDFFSNVNLEGNKFLKANRIKYIYIPKIFKIQLNFDKVSTKLIYENEEIQIYEVVNT